MTGDPAARTAALVAGRGWMGVPRVVDGYPELRVLGHARLDRGQARRLARMEERSLAILTEWIARCRQPYVSLSGGKDSTVLLHLARRVDPGIHVIYGEDEDGTFPDVVQVVDYWEAQGAAIRRFYWESWPRLFHEHGLDSPIPGRRFGAQFDRLSREWGYDGAACGYRKEESRTRAIHGNQRGHLWFQETMQRWRCDPLLDWTAHDIWSYIAREAIPYPVLYDVEDGEPRERRRVGSPFGLTSAPYGRLARLKRFWPEWYQRFVSLCPEAALYT